MTNHKLSLQFAIKPFWMLSKGQKYRAQLADMILKNSPVWLLDEFASDLDPITATIVAKKVRSITKKYGIITIAAAANHQHYIATLRPSRVLYFDFGLEPRQLTYMEYKNEFC